MALSCWQLNLKIDNNFQYRLICKKSFGKVVIVSSIKQINLVAEEAFSTKFIHNIQGTIL